MPGISFEVANKIAHANHTAVSITLRFRSLSDFAPAAVVRQIPWAAELLDEWDFLTSADQAALPTEELGSNSDRIALIDQLLT